MNVLYQMQMRLHQEKETLSSFKQSKKILFEKNETRNRVMKKEKRCILQKNLIVKTWYINLMFKSLLIFHYFFIDLGECEHFEESLKKMGEQKGKKNYFYNIIYIYIYIYIFVIYDIYICNIYYLFMYNINTYNIWHVYIW